MDTMTGTVSDTKAKMQDLASRMLSGAIDLLEGARQMADLSRRLPEPESAAQDVLTFVAVDSEVDDIPMGAARSRWAPAALAEKDRARAEYLDRARAAIEDACRSIIARFA